MEVFFWQPAVNWDAKLEHTHSVLLGNLQISEILSNSKPVPKLSKRSADLKKVVFSPGQFGPWPELKGKSGEIRSLLKTLGGTL